MRRGGTGRGADGRERGERWAGSCGTFCPDSCSPPFTLSTNGLMPPTYTSEAILCKQKIRGVLGDRVGENWHSFPCLFSSCLFLLLSFSGLKKHMKNTHIKDRREPQHREMGNPLKSLGGGGGAFQEEQCLFFFTFPGRTILWVGPKLGRGGFSKCLSVYFLMLCFLYFQWARATNCNLQKRGWRFTANLCLHRP